MGAIRVGKLAKFLLSRGHDVRVLSAEGTGPSETMPLEISTDRVMYTSWRDINWMPKAVVGILGRLFGGVRIHNGAVSAGASASGTQTGAEKSHGWSWREVLYRSILNWPDQWVGWMPAALSGARRILSEWSPEIIYASGPPHTGLVIAHLLARRHGLPWIAELRARWIDDPFRR